LPKFLAFPSTKLARIPFPKSTLMRLFTGILAFVASLLCASTVFSQTTIGGNAFYHLPSGTLKDYYSPAPGYAITLRKKNQLTGWWLDSELGFTLFSPRASVFEIEPLTNFQSRSYATLTDYLLFHLSVGGHHKFVETEKLKLYGGMSLAYVFFMVRAELDGHSGRANGGSKVGLIPRAGIQVNLGPDLALLVEGRYNFTMQSLDDGDVLPGKQLGNIDTFFSLGAGFVYYLNHDK
jgi:hypothetical protein